MTTPFPHSPWSKIAALKSTLEPDRRGLLQQIFTLYWKPVFAFASRSYPASDPADLTQNVFAYILKHDTLDKAEQSRGRLRSFIIAVTRGVASTGWHRERNHRDTLPIDSAEGQKFVAGLADMNTESPDDFVDRAFAITVFRRSVAQLSAEYKKSGKAALFETLCTLATGDPKPAYGKAAAATGTSAETLRVQVFRFRQRLREIFAAEVASLVDDPDELQAELRHLLKNLARRGTL